MMGTCGGGLLDSLAQAGSGPDCANDDVGVAVLCSSVLNANVNGLEWDDVNGSPTQEVF